MKIPQSFWGYQKQFVVDPAGNVWEKDRMDCWMWEVEDGEFGRVQTGSTKWYDLIKTAVPLVSITRTDAILILLARWVGEVAGNAEADKDYLLSRVRDIERQQ